MKIFFKKHSLLIKIIMNDQHRSLIEIIKFILIFEILSN
jgi:hypothetical protein